MKKYKIIYADPPWRYARSKVQGAAEKHYPTMSIEELCALPVKEIADKDCILFLWATFPQLKEALQLIKAGREEMRKSACLLPKDTRSDNQTRYINLLFPLLSSTAKSRI